MKTYKIPQGRAMHKDIILRHVESVDAITEISRSEAGGGTHMNFCVHMVSGDFHAVDARTGEGLTLFELRGWIETERQKLIAALEEALV